MNEFTAYLEALKTGEKSPHTIRLYTKDLKKFYDFFNIKSVNDINKLAVADFHNFYNSQKISPNSLNGLIRSLNAYFIWLSDSGYISMEHNFFKVRFGKSRFVKVNREKKVVLSSEEENMLIKAGGNLQEKFMIAVMLKTALRRSEITAIKLSDIKGCEILITGKGGDQAYTYLNETLCHMLSMYMTEERTSNSPYLFYSRHGEKSNNGQLSTVSVNNRVKACAKRSGISEEKIKKLTAHRLRGTAITRIALTEGKHAAQMVARHKSSMTTDLYISTDETFVKQLLMKE
jgi:integrase/recombinase XerD